MFKYRVTPTCAKYRNKKEEEYKSLLIRLFVCFFEYLEPNEKLIGIAKSVEYYHIRYIENIEMLDTKSSYDVQSYSQNHWQINKKAYISSSECLYKMKYSILAYTTINFKNFTGKPEQIENTIIELYRQLVLIPINDYLESIGIEKLQIRVKRREGLKKTNFTRKQLEKFFTKSQPPKNEARGEVNFRTLNKKKDKSNQL